MAERPPKRHKAALALLAAAHVWASGAAAGAAGTVYLTGLQAGAAAPLQLSCALPGGAALFPLPVSAAALRTAPGGLAVGPLLAGETLLCALAPGAGAGANRTACAASYAALRAPVACAAAGGAPGYELQCDGCAPAPPPAPPPPAAPLCAGLTTLTAAAGSFTDGAPRGGQYGPGSACAWLLAPGYAYVRLNFSRFATEPGFDPVTVVAVHDDGRNETPLSVVVPAARALVIFTSDEAVQAAGFAAAWDPGPFCAPAATLTAAAGTLTDGAPRGVPYRPWTQCSWAIAPGYSPVVLRFQRFGLADADAVTVYAGGLDGGVLARFTGAGARGALPPPVASDGSAGTAAGGDVTLFDFALQVNASATLLVVFSAGAGPGGSGFEATWADAPSFGPSIALSAAVIIGAVVFGLACGTALGLLLIKCYGYHRYRSFGGRVLSLPEFALLRWTLGGGGAPAPRGGAWARQPSLDPADAAAAAGGGRARAAPWAWRWRRARWAAPALPGELALLAAPAPGPPNTPTTPAAAGGPGGGGPRPELPAAPPGAAAGGWAAPGGAWRWRRLGRGAPPARGELALQSARGGPDAGPSGSPDAPAPREQAAASADSGARDSFSIPAFRPAVP